MRPTLSHVDGIAWPPILTGDAATLAALVAQFERTQWLGAEEIAARQRRQLALLLDHHARHSPFFAARLAAAGMSAAEAAGEGFVALPLTTRRDLQTADGLFAAELPARHGPAAEVNTSGSTGEPVHVRRTALNQLDWLALTMRDHIWHRRDFSRRLAAIRAHIDGVRRLDSWGPPASLLHRTANSIGIDMRLAVTAQLAVLRDFAPGSLLIYPSNLDGLLDAIEADGRSLDGIADVRTMGERLLPGTRARAEAMLGAAVADSYSSQELGYITLQCAESGLYHVMAETLLVEVLDDAGRPCQAGEIGRVVATDLRNFSTPLIRYAIADHAEVAPPCPCGRGLPTLARIVGRTRNLLVKPNGDRSWPLLGYARFRALAGVIQHQFIQHDLHRIEVRMLLEAPLTPEREAALRAHIQQALGFPFQLDFTYLDGRIEPGPSGKFEEFISRVAAP